MATFKQAQTYLAVTGYYDGPINGDPDENFRADLKRFQRDHPPLKADGVYGTKTDGVLVPEGKKALAFQAEQKPGEMIRLARWDVTQYWVEAFTDGAGSVPLPDAAGRPLAMGRSVDFQQAALEGTTLERRSNRLINTASVYVGVPVGDPTYDGVLAIAKRNGWVPEKPGYAGLGLDAAGRVNRVMAFKVVKPGKYGFPIWQGIDARPYRTVAADLGKYKTSDKRFRGKGGLCPVGTRAYILELDGRQLPDGSVHDGWVIVNDTGGGIFGAHFDLFVGMEEGRLTMPERCHIWWPGMESRVDINYSYGL